MKELTNRELSGFSCIGLGRQSGAHCFRLGWEPCVRQRLVYMVVLLEITLRAGRSSSEKTRCKGSRKCWKAFAAFWCCISKAFRGL